MQMTVLKTGMMAFSRCLAVVLACCTLSCYAVVHQVHNATELIEVLNSPTTGGFGAEMELVEDIDFQNTLKLPLGASSESSSCIAFTGKLNGNGHSIKGIKMENTGEIDSGLFCCLEHATIENLIIDDSCSFLGYNTGALAVTAKGSLTIRNVIIRARLDMNYRGSGFIATIEGLQQGDSVLFERCTFDGHISSSIGFDTGGFIGCAFDNKDANITIRDCVNNGEISALRSIGGFIGALWKDFFLNVMIVDSRNSNKVESGQGDINVGGFIGNVAGTHDTKLSLINCRNDGQISGIDFIGGLIGMYSWNQRSTCMIESCTNNGIIKSSNSVGGLFGGINEDLDGNVLINCSSNTERVEGNKYSSGLVGTINAFNGNTPVHLTIKNSANKGIIDGKSGVACGLFCVNQTEGNKVMVDVANSINRGEVDGEKAYGISTSAYSANNIVSLGSLSTNTEYCSFWESCQSCNSLYALRTVGRFCGGCSFDEIEYDTSQDLFKTIGGDIVHINLNKEAINKNYGMGWTGDLEFILLQVVIGNPINVIVPVIPYDTISNVFERLNIPVDGYVIVNKSNKQILQTSATLESNTELELYHTINYSGVIKGVTIIKHGDILESNADMREYLTNDYLFTSLTDSTLVYDNNTKVVENLNIIITAVKRTEIEIDLGNESGANDTTVRDAIRDKINSNGDTPAQVIVISEDDGVFRVLLVLPEEETETLINDLLSCSESS